MPIFFASTAKGLVEPLEQELKDLGFHTIDRVASGVFFETNWEGCYKANLCSRLASRILKPILDFNAYNGEDLYHNIKKHDFTKYIDLNQTLKFDASVENCAMRDQRFVAMKAKDAVVDQFRDKFGERPNVENYNPDLKIFIKATNDNYHVMIDTSGDSLFMRGYRKEAGDAPMKENLAAGLVYLAGWDKKTPVFDPMCGSGTIVIEAAMMYANIAPGMNRRSFGFQKLKGFDKAAWERVIDETIAQEKVFDSAEEIPNMFFGSDVDQKVVRMARVNAAQAGVEHLVQFKCESVSTIKPPFQNGVIITNPPYAVRLGDEDNVKDVYKDFAHSMKVNFKGWDAWILSGNKDMIGALKLKAARKIFVYNGPLECRFLKYPIT